MNIGFDLDKIFIDYPPIIPDKLIDRLYKKKANGELVYRIPSKPEQYIRRLSHLSLLRPSIRKNISFLKSLPKNEHNLYLISSRYGFLKDVTENRMRSEGFDKVFNQLFFNFTNKQPHLFKADVLKNMKMDIYVDDDIHLLKHVAKENPETTFFWLTQEKYGPKLPPNVIKIHDLTDILKKKKYDTK